MLILGLAGNAGTGKDSVADYLVSRYGFIKFSFSDALYDEVQCAFGLETQDILRDRATKDKPHDRLTLQMCYSDEFRDIVWHTIAEGPQGVLWSHTALSPRQVLQWWGTEYRRAQDPDYWLKKAGEFVYQVHHFPPYPEHRPRLFVNTSVRYANEQAWVRGLRGNVWHLRRDDIVPVNQHSSEDPLEVLEGERELWNNDTLDRLYQGVDLLLHTQARFVRMEPMLPDEEQAVPSTTEH